MTSVNLNAGILAAFGVGLLISRGRHMRGRLRAATAVDLMSEHLSFTPNPIKQFRGIPVKTMLFVLFFKQFLNSYHQLFDIRINRRDLHLNLSFTSNQHEQNPDAHTASPNSHNAAAHSNISSLAQSWLGQTVKSTREVPA